MIKLISWGIFFLSCLVMGFYMIAKTGLLDKYDNLEESVKEYKRNR